jgi:hypothetical protein
MARKRRKSKVSGVKRRRSSRSNMGGIDVTNILSVVGGAVIAGYINKLIPAKVNDKVVAGGKVALGIALPMLSKSGATKNILSGVGAGMIAVGSVDLLKSFGALSGDFDIPVINGDVLAGLDIVNGDVLAGDDIPVINGMDDFMGQDEFGQDEFGADEFGADEFGADEFGADDDF